MRDFLLEIAGNEIPEAAHSGFIVARGNKRLRYALFAAGGRPVKGTVLVLTGRNEPIEKYFETVRSLSKRGFGAAIFDWRGQGLSDRELTDPLRGHVDDFDLYAEDLDSFFREVVLPDCRGPYYVLAHSTGALIALRAAPALNNRIERMVLLAPLLQLGSLSVSAGSIRRLASVLKLAGFGNFYATGGRWKPTPFERNNVTSDPERYERNVRLFTTHPRLSLGGPTITWMHAAADAARLVSDPDYTARLHIPTLFVAAGADVVVSSRAIEQYARRLRSGYCVTIDGARHEILQERDYYLEQFWAAFDAYIPGSAS
ncbi:MAG: alpha/beta hydrolase [Rhizobiaceae bacterium]|nr:alpha/beta hydrolase [Rhizobiaceae bacterium]